MWDLKPSDIERAKQALGDRRAEALRRQQAELEGLAADQAAIDSLDRLAEAFCQKFRKAVNSATAQVAATTPPEPAPAVEPEPPPAVKPPVPVAAAKPSLPMPAILRARDKPARERPTPERRDLSGTNFDIFRRAVSKSTF